MYNIYRITNRSNGRTYIGMTKGTVAARFDRHINHLHRGVHCNDQMQRDWHFGFNELVVERIARRTDKEAAKKLETKLMNAEPNPYNIAKGNKGDMAGRTRKIRPFARPYVYAEVIALKAFPQAWIMENFDIGQPMISMIQNGHRTAPEPQTSFKEVPCDPYTIVEAWNPARAECAAIYAEAA
jgi:predicted GIY-YIG superfamily endonuclease